MASWILTRDLHVITHQLCQFHLLLWRWFLWHCILFAWFLSYLEEVLFYPRYNLMLCVQFLMTSLANCGAGIHVCFCWTYMHAHKYMSVHPPDHQMKLSARNKFACSVLKSKSPKGKHLKKNVLVLSRASGAASSSEGPPTLTSTNQGETGSASRDRMPVVILDSEAQVNCTGNFKVFSKIGVGEDHIVLVGAFQEERDTYFSGSVRNGMFELDDVHFCPQLGNRIIVSGPLLDNHGFGYEFGRGRCSVTDFRTGRIIGEGRLVDGNYVLDYLRIPRDTIPVPEEPRDTIPVPEQPGLATRIWNAVCSAFRRLGLNPQGLPR